MAFDKLKFWKKEEQIPDYPQPEQDFGRPESFNQPSEHDFSPQAFEQKSAFEQKASTEQQIQLIFAKLDTIKAQLETVLQKLDVQDRKEERPYQQRWKNL